MLQKILDVAKEVLSEAGYASPAGSYWACREVSGVLLYVLSQFGYEIDVYEAYLRYPDGAAYIDPDAAEGDVGHYFLVIGTTVYDFTARQFLPEAAFPHIVDIGSEDFSAHYRRARKSKRHALDFITYALDGSSEGNAKLAITILDRVRSER